MKPKLLFWIDAGYSHFGLAKYIQDNLNCELYTIADVTDKPRKFFQSQKLVKFRKIWYLHDHILKIKRKPDLSYLKSIEEKYGISLWLIAANDRFFNHFNLFYKFSSDEILSILEDEIKLFEMILDEVKPDFLIIWETHQQHNHIFYEICRARNVKILMMVGARVFSPKIFTLSDETDKFLPLPKTVKPDNYKKISQKEKFENTIKSNSGKRVPDTIYDKFQTSRLKYYKAILKFLFTKDTNVQTHFTYFGRSKIKVIFKMLAYLARKKYRENFMDKNLSKNIENDSPFIYYPLHQEVERILMLGAPFFMNQYEVLANIAQSLPIGYKLYVKEHNIMDIRGWRSVSEMKKIMNLYNVKLFHYSTNSEELIKKSSLVITIRGSSAIEAAFHNKPSIIFGNVGLYQLSSIHRLRSITELPQAIKKSLKKKVNPNEFKKYVDAVNEQSFESEYGKIYAEFEDQFKVGGYYINVEIDSQKMIDILEKFKPELTHLALIHIEKIKQLSN